MLCYVVLVVRIQGIASRFSVRRSLHGVARGTGRLSKNREQKAKSLASTPVKELITTCCGNELHIIHTLIPRSTRLRCAAHPHDAVFRSCNLVPWLFGLGPAILSVPSSRVYGDVIAMIGMGK